MAAVNKNNVIQKVLSIIENKIDGDSVMLVESHLPNALKSVCKFVSENKPRGHEKLLMEQYLGNFYEYNSDAGSISDDPFGYFLLTDASYPFIEDKLLNRIKLELEGYVFTAEPVYTKNVLALSRQHDVVYYFSNYPYIHMGFPIQISVPQEDIGNPSEIDSGLEIPVPTAGRLRIRHYIYATIDQFPEELEDYLVMELVKIIQNEPIKRQAGV